MARKAKRGPKTLFDKIKEVDPYFCEEMYSATDEKLLERLSQIAKDTTSNEIARDADIDLLRLKEQVKVAGETYSIPLKALKMKRRFVYDILKERGKAP
jgi:hypothetical protein